MKKVERHEILDYVTYEEQRTEIRSRAMEAKTPRRIHLGENLTFLFENHETIRYQVLEMVRAEQLVREADIQHELDTYNELIPAEGGLSATLLVEIEDRAERDAKLMEWLNLPEKLYLGFDDGTRAYAAADERQSDGERISSVQFLTFDCSGRVPETIGVDHPALQIESRLTTEQQAALASDLGIEQTSQAVS